MKKILSAAMSLCMALCCLSAVACHAGTDADDTSFIKSASMVVTGYEWGPAVNGVIVRFDGTLDEAPSPAAFEVKTGRETRKVERTYLCGADGSVTDMPSEYVSFEMSVNSYTGSPFTYAWDDGIGQYLNTWTEPYGITLTVAEGEAVEIGGRIYREGSSASADMSGNRILPDIDGIWETGTYTYEGYVECTDSEERITLSTAFYAPDGADGDGTENPLIIWLHGAGEGGTDPTIPLLGAEVTALSRDGIQSYFREDGSAGAYVLAVQTDTYWVYGHEGRENGDGTYDVTDSYYTEALQETIEETVRSCGDIDADRIILGGCSNGGYMTMNLMFRYGDYYAAYYPVCECYSDAYITDEMIEGARDASVWFVHAENDPNVSPKKNTVPTFCRLLEAGAGDVHFTYTGEVTGTDDPGATYNAHFSWVYLFNDEITYEFDNPAALLGGEEYVTHANCTKEGVNIFEWMSRASRVK